MIRYTQWLQPGIARYVVGHTDRPLKLVPGEYWVTIRGRCHLKQFERSKIKLPLQKNLLLSLDPAMMVKLIGLIL